MWVAMRWVPLEAYIARVKPHYPPPTERAIYMSPLWEIFSPGVHTTAASVLGNAFFPSSRKGNVNHKAGKTYSGALTLNAEEHEALDSCSAAKQSPDAWSSPAIPRDDVHLGTSASLESGLGLRA